MVISPSHIKQYRDILITVLLIFWFDIIITAITSILFSMRSGAHLRHRVLCARRQRALHSTFEIVRDQLNYEAS